MGLLRSLLSSAMSLFSSRKSRAAGAAPLYAVLGIVGREMESELGLSDDSERVLCRCVVMALLGMTCGMNMLPERDMADMGRVRHCLRMAASGVLDNADMVDMMYEDYREDVGRPATPFGTPRPASVHVLPKSAMLGMISRLAHIS